jgi:hypothetical protein
MHVSARASAVAAAFAVVLVGIHSLTPLGSTFIDGACASSEGAAPTPE